MKTAGASESPSALHDESAAKSICPRCHGSSRERSRIRWYEVWRKVVSRRRPFRCTTCRRRAWAAMPARAPESVAPDARFDAFALANLDIDLSALDAISTDDAASEDR